MPHADILIDVTRLLGRLVLKGRLPTGVDRVSLAYVAHYLQRALAVVRMGPRHVLLSASASQALFGLLLNPAPRISPSWVLQLIKAWLWRPRFPDHALLINTGHSGPDHPAYPEEMQRLGVMPVYLVHDLIPISHPEYCREGEYERHQRRMAGAIKASGGLIANSEATLDELKIHAARMGWPMPPAVVAHLAAPTLPPPGDNPVGKPYFVVLGTIEPRKNHWMMLQVWRRLIEKYGSQAPQLIVIGQRGWKCENVVDLLERGVHLREHVIELPSCSDGLLATYLHHAVALLFPTFAEGYGLPLIEALSVGTPVIASDLAVFREVAGNIPEYLDPLDGPAWLAAIEAYAAPVSEPRDAQINRMAGFVPPVWADHFQRVDAFLDSLQ